MAISKAIYDLYLGRKCERTVFYHTVLLTTPEYSIKYFGGEDFGHSGTPIVQS